MYVGKCHCGNVELSIPHLSEKAVRCNCSVCNRYSAIWGYFEEQEVEVSIGKAGASKYAQGDKTIAFVSCKKCHCITHYVSTKSAPDARFAINYRMFDATLLKDIKVIYFDGADSWKRIAKKRWMHDG